MRNAIVVFMVVAWFTIGSPAHGDAVVSFHFGAHHYGVEGTHSLLGLEGGYRFETPVSLTLGGHYLSRDLGGTATGFQQYRASLGADYHLAFWCLVPFDLSPGLGVAYSLRDQGETSHILGGYVRARLLVPLAEGLSAGILHRLDWNRTERPGREFAAVVRFTFQ